MPTFGKKPDTIEDTMAGLEGPLLRFHEASEGDLADVAVLFKTMSGQMLPPPVLCEIMGVPPEEMLGASSSNPIKISPQQLLAGVAAALDESDTAAMYIDKITACTAGVSERKEVEKLRSAINLDEATAVDLETRITKSMQADTDLLAHLAGLRDLHDKWRANSPDTSDPTRFPTVVVGPQILGFQPMITAHLAQVLTASEREQMHLRAGESSVELLRDKLGPVRRSCGAVASALRERIAWLGSQATGLEVKAEALDDSAGIAAFDRALSADVMSTDFQSKVGGILQDVKLGPSSERIDAVEAEIAKAMARAGAALAVPVEGYDAVVFHACLRALAEELSCDGSMSSSQLPVTESLQAVKSTRRKIGDRFFRKKWLPLESNPDVFNQLGRQLGLPTGAAEFFEVYGLDPELLQMVPAPAYAVLVCFPLTAEYRAAAGEAEAAGCEGGPYFMHQTVPNACGTVALVHAFANLPDPLKAAMPSSGADAWLQAFVSKTKGMDALGRAAALEDDEGLAATHNALAQQGDTNVHDFEAPSAARSAFQAVLHFVCYVHHDGVLYELDGLKKGPVARGPTTQDRLLQDSAECVKQLLAGDTDELRVNLMALASASSAQTQG